MVRFTLRLTDEQHAKLRWLAYRGRRSQHAIIMELLDKALADVTVPEDANLPSDDEEEVSR